MKRIETWSDQLKHLVDGTTPVMEIDAGPHCIRLYWTTGGAYGQQIRLIVYKNLRGDTASECYTMRTTGCGYSKTQEAIECAFRFLGLTPAKWTTGDDRLYAYHVGGNYYKIQD
jgi:hypothetical protein